METVLHLKGGCVFWTYIMYNVFFWNVIYILYRLRTIDICCIHGYLWLGEILPCMMRICTTANPKTNHANHWTIPVLCFHPLRTCMQKLHIHLILYMMVCLVHQNDCIVHHYTVYHFLDMHCCTYCNKKVTGDLVASTLYISNIQKKRSNMYRRGWENKQNVRRLYAMSGGKWVYQLTNLVSPTIAAV